MTIVDDATAIYILKAIAESQLKPTLGGPELTPELHDALAAA